MGVCNARAWLNSSSSDEDCEADNGELRGEQRGFHAEARKGRHVPVPERHCSDDLYESCQSINPITIKTINGLPDVSHHPSVSELGGSTMVLVVKTYCITSSLPYLHRQSEKM